MQESELLDINKFININKEITYIYGQAGSGKTTLAMLSCVDVIKKGKKVIFIDTENGVSVERLKQLCNFESLLENIFLIKITDFEDQCKKIENLMNIYKMFDLIILDTIGSIYREELKKDSIGTNIKVVKQLKTLVSISKEVPVIITNQVYKDIENNKIRAVGGNIAKNFCDCAIKLEKDERTEKRRLSLLNQGNLKEFLFEIKEDGIYKC